MPSELKQLHEANNLLFCQLQQQLEENAEYRRCLEEILDSLQRLKTRMRPVLARKKARPKP